MKTKAVVLLLPLLVVLFFVGRGALAADAVEFQVIVHPGVQATSLERQFVAASFLKKVTRWENGDTVHPVDLNSRSVIRAEFSHNVLKRSVAAVRNYWQQRIFSGRDVPPLEIETERAVMRYVATHPGAIGYVSASLQLKEVRAVRLK